MPTTEIPLTADLLNSLVSEATAELITQLDCPDDDVEHLRKILNDLRDRVQLGADNHPSGLLIGTAMLVLNDAADATADEWKLHDIGERDAINFVVNVVGNSLRGGELANFDAVAVAVAEDNYDIDSDDLEDAGSALEVVLGWIRSGL
ncbi:hypothetical protein [Rhodococcus sp. Q]|uniref:hypothetical protein n=1 Tax=Rhodococcus sp. Q TaxID=2502252 RepID=UPI0010F7BA60|nr:hypothetical protein [Rhodococcus sp. Q]